MHEHDDNPCWDAHCAPHLTHHDAGVRELIARAEARGAERVTRAVERLINEWDDDWIDGTLHRNHDSRIGIAARKGAANRLRAVLTEHHTGATR